MALLPFLCSVHAAAGAAVGGLHWVNWNGAHRCQPRDFFQPADETELARYVRAAAARNETVKVVGAAHSLSDIGMCEDGGHIVSLDRLDRVERVERHVGRANVSRVTVQAGIRLHALNAQLERAGLALRNIGTSAEQSLAGATQAGTHGTGPTGSMPTQIAGLRLVTAAGDVLSVDPRSDPELFSAARLGLGALGIVTACTLEVVDLWRMELTVATVPLDELPARLPALQAAHPYLKWAWVPRAANATVTLATPTRAPVAAGCWRGGPLSAGCSSCACDVGASCVDVAYKTLTTSAECSRAQPLDRDMEVSVPVGDVPAVVAEFRAFQAGLPQPAASTTRLLTEVRYVHADDIPLSTQFGRASAIIAMLAIGDTAAPGDEAVFRRHAAALERICARHGGRAHWGKTSYGTAADIARAYPDTLAPFLALRKRMDPRGMFLNGYLRRMLGLAN